MDYRRAQVFGLRAVRYCLYAPASCFGMPPDPFVFRKAHVLLMQRIGRIFPSTSPATMCRSRQTGPPPREHGVSRRQAQGDRDASLDLIVDPGGAVLDCSKDQPRVDDGWPSFDLLWISINRPVNLRCSSSRVEEITASTPRAIGSPAFSNVLHQPALGLYKQFRIRKNDVDQTAPAACSIQMRRYYSRAGDKSSSLRFNNIAL